LVKNAAVARGLYRKLIHHTPNGYYIISGIAFPPMSPHLGNLITVSKERKLSFQQSFVILKRKAEIVASQFKEKINEKVYDSFQFE